MTGLLRPRLFNLVLLLAAIPAHAQRRTIMEGLWAGNNALFVSTPTANVYVRTAGSMTVAGAFSAASASIPTFTSSITMSGTNAILLGNDIGVQWGTSANNINGNVTRINAVIGNATEMSITPTGTVVIDSFTISGAALRVGAASGGEIQLGGAPAVNGTGRLKFITSNSVKNWQISNNDAYADDIEFTPSTTSGGSTFTTPAMTISAAGVVAATSYTGSGASLTGLPGGGDATLAGTQTFTGAKTFSAAAVFTSSLTANGFVSGFIHAIATATVSDKASYTFSNLSSSYTYTLAIVADGQGPTTGGIWRLRFNGDSGNNYNYNCSGSDDQASSYFVGGSNQAQGVIGNSSANDPGDDYRARISFSSQLLSPLRVTWEGGVEQNVSGSDRELQLHCGGRYSGAALLSSVTFLTSAENFTGRLVLFREEIAYP